MRPTLRASSFQPRLSRDLRPESAGACAAKKPMTVNQRRENPQDRIAQGAKSGGDTRWKFSQPIKSGVPRTSTLKSHHPI